MSSEDLKEENAALRAKLREVEQRLADNERRARVLQATLDSIKDGVVVWGTNGDPTHVNPAAMDFVGQVHAARRHDEAAKLFGVFRADGVTPFPYEDLPTRRALQGEHVEGVEVVVRSPESPRDSVMLTSASPIYTEEGALLGAVLVFRDVTEHKRLEQRQRDAEYDREQMVARLELAVHELSTPVLEVWDDVLVLPVVGVVDSQRSAEMMERLLEAVQRRQCRHVIIDITGVEVIDSETAHQFIKLVTAVEYLGARCVLTGTRPTVAQTLVSLGMELGSLTMLRTLKHGLRECMRRMEAEPARRSGRAVFTAARERAGRATGALS